MPLYKEDFPVGSRVRIADATQLQEFRRTWQYHHKLRSEQLAYAGRIVEVEKVSFYHGGDVLYELRGIPGIWHEQCLRPAAQGTRKYVYDASGNLLVEEDANGNILKYFIYGKGLLAWVVAASSNLYCYHFDGTGNTVAVTDVNQNVVNSYGYDAYGTVTSQLEQATPVNTAQPFKFVGQFGAMAEPNGLYYMRARYYDPSVGRFISEDPLGLGGGDTNPYAYAGNNPINGIDPTGLLTLLITTHDTTAWGYIGFYSHSALYINTAGQAYLIDAGGSYMSSEGGRGDQWIFSGSDANLSNYVAYQQSPGSTVTLTNIAATPNQEAAILTQANQISETDPGVPNCAIAVSSALVGAGVPDFQKTYTPGNLLDQAINANNVKCNQ
jgi:RHS repeat-associated protein